MKPAELILVAIAAAAVVTAVYLVSQPAREEAVSGIPGLDFPVNFTV